MKNRNETFYFLKVELGIDTCEEVAAIERLKHGPEYLWLWIRLALKYANYGGVLCRRIGENVLPVTADDLEAEMKGGFTDVSIKDGVATLIQGSLIYINSDGFMAITGLTISGDPKEPTLHKQNSNTDVVRPLSIGNDTKSAQYQRERRKQLKEREAIAALPAATDTTMTYADIAKKARCTKQTVSNYVRKYKLEEWLISKGQKKMIPYHFGQFLICMITNIKVSPEIQESLIADGFDGYQFDGFDGYHLPSKTIKEPSNEPSKTVKGPSKESAENPHEISVFDGLSNDNHSDSLDDNHSLFESKESKNKQEYIKETVKDRLRLIEIYHIGFDRDPDASELSLLIDLLKKTDYSLLLQNLKITRKYHGENLAYTVACLQRCFESGINDSSDLNQTEVVDPDRDIESLLVRIDEGLSGRQQETIEAVKENCQYYAPYYTDAELIEATRNADIYRRYDRDSFQWLINHQVLGSEVLDALWEECRQ